MAYSTHHYYTTLSHEDLMIPSYYMTPPPAYRTLPPTPVLDTDAPSTTTSDDSEDESTEGLPCPPPSHFAPANIVIRPDSPPIAKKFRIDPLLCQSGVLQVPKAPKLRILDLPPECDPQPRVGISIEAGLKGINTDYSDAYPITVYLNPMRGRNQSQVEKAVIENCNAALDVTIRNLDLILIFRRDPYHEITELKYLLTTLRTRGPGSWSRVTHAKSKAASAAALTQYLLCFNSGTVRFNLEERDYMSPLESEVILSLLCKLKNTVS